MSLILTGTTGRLGSLVFHHLLSLVPAERIIVSLFNVDGAASEELRKKKVEVRRGDYLDPHSLENAFQGGEKLFLVSVPSPENQERFEKHKNAIDAAKKVGVTHIYYTSLAFSDDSNASIFQAHLATEKYLKNIGITYTIIREGLYAEFFPAYLGFFNPYVKDDIILTHDDGPVSFTAVEDLGEATAKIIASDGFKNETVTLTAPKSYTLKETVALVSTVFGRNFPITHLSDEEWLKVQNRGRFGDLWITIYPSLAKGEAAIVDPLLEKLVGRNPISFEQIIRKRTKPEAFDEILGRGKK